MFVEFARQRKIFLLLPLVFCLSAGAALAQGTAFTFQGKLGDSGSPVNNALDMQFKLFDGADPNNSSQIGTTITLNNPLVQVTNGVFTVQLDFGAASLPGADRFLEIGIRLNNTDPYTLLSPRTKITSSPYAIRSLNATGADGLSSACVGCIQSSQISSVDASKLTGTVPPGAITASSLPPGSINYIQNRTTGQAGNFNISGNGTAGTFSATSFNADTQYNIGNFRVLSTPGPNTFVGVLAGANNRVSFGHGVLNTFFGGEAGGGNTDGASNSFFGSSAGLANQTGSNLTAVGANATVGSDGLVYATAIGAGAQVNASNTIALGRIDGSDSVVIYGLGMAGSTQLCRNTLNQIANCSSSLRYKTKITPFGLGLNVVNRLSPITFNWKQGGMKDLGLGAEDVEKVAPLLVTYNDKGEVEGVKYDRVAVVLINAVKEQQSQIEAQQKLIERQQLEINGLKQIVFLRPARGRSSAIRHSKSR